MIASLRSAVFRRTFAGSLALGTVVTACVAQAATYTMYRDPNCGCCLDWAEHVEQGAKHEVVAIDHSNMSQVKAEHGVPADLQSCHTMMVDGFVIEGHVPQADIARLLRERPENITGLAVAGMPLGSPGMEHGNRSQPYEVIAFGPEGRSVFASYR